ARSAEQQTGPAGLVERGAQFFPSGLELSRGAHVAEFVEPGKLQQDVEAANKLARGGSGVNGHGLAERVTRCRSQVATNIRNAWTQLNKQSSCTYYYTRLAGGR